MATNFNYLENTLQEINSQYIALEESEERKNSAILINVVNQVITKMKENKLFKALYRKEYSGGSYYCGLKVGKPDEYDIDLLFQLPTLCNAEIINSDVEGFVHIKMQDMQNFYKQLQLSQEYPDLKKHLMDDENNLSTEKVLDWMESVINKALNQFKFRGENFARIATPYELYYVNLHKQGPAFTLDLYKNLRSNSSSYVMSVDLVPCFVFTDKDWPEYPYRANPSQKKNEFFVVPKRIPKCLCDDLYYSKEIYWRLSFQEQENEIIKSSQNLKPALRLLKRIRDAWDHKAVSSYYIKTIFLWTIELNDIDWNKSLSYVFMTMLKKYQQYIERGNIPYYWNDNLNLLYGVDDSQLYNTSNKLKKIIKDIEKYQENPHGIQKCFYGPNWIQPADGPNWMQPESIRYSDLSRVKTDNDNKGSDWLIILIILVMISFVYFFGKSNNTNS